VDAHVYAGWTYEYMLDTLGWNSFDNFGSSMLSTVEREPAQNNAAFDTLTDRVYYYRPTSSVYNSLAGGVDLVAHEWGHGLTKYSSGLLPLRESGALSESFSDMLGAAVGFATNDPDWLILDNVYPPSPYLFARDMEDPLNSLQPDTVGADNWVNPNCAIPNPGNDFCGIHKNSGVPNKMFHLLSVGGNHYGVNVTGIGINKAIRIMYEANITQWLDAAIGFADAASGSVRAALQLDSTGTWGKRTGKAWEAVRVCKAMPGDGNASKTYSLGDIIAIVNYIFNKPGCSPQPLCWLSGLVCRGDCTGDGEVSIGDIIHLVNYIFAKPCPNPSHPASGCWLPRPSNICCTYYP
jgi:Zn-dependent metalloprotease